MRRFYSLFVLILISISCSACTLLRAKPAELSGFLPKGELVAEHRDRAPFNGYWVFDELQYQKLREHYGKVYVAPIDTSFVEQMYQAASGSEKTKRVRIQEAQELANYFREKVRLLLREMSNKRFQIVDQAGPETLSLKLALVKVVPTNPGVNLIGTAAGFFVPGGGLIKLAGEGSVAMEGFVAEEDQTFELYEQFKDREGQKISPFTLKDYQRYAHIRVAIDAWSMQLVELLTTPADHTVADSDLISINPL